jgi:hypothetical protein
MTLAPHPSAGQQGEPFPSTLIISGIAIVLFKPPKLLLVQDIFDLSLNILLKQSFVLGLTLFSFFRLHPSKIAPQSMLHQKEGSERANRSKKVNRSRLTITIALGLGSET